MLFSSCPNEFTSSFQVFLNQRKSNSKNVYYTQVYVLDFNMTMELVKASLKFISELLFTFSNFRFAASDGNRFDTKKVRKCSSHWLGKHENVKTGLDSLMPYLVTCCSGPVQIFFTILKCVYMFFEVFLNQRA